MVRVHDGALSLVASPFFDGHNRLGKSGRIARRPPRPRNGFGFFTASVFWLCPVCPSWIFVFGSVSLEKVVVMPRVSWVDGLQERLGMWRKRRSRVTRQRRQHGPTVEALEPRAMLATIDFTGATLTLTLGANEKVVVSNPATNQIRFNVTPYSPGVSNGGGLTLIGGGTLIAIGGSLNFGGSQVVPSTGVTSVTGGPIGFSVVGYGTDTTGTLPSAVSLVIKGAHGSAQAVDFQQSTNGAFVTSSRTSVDLGNDAHDDVTFSGAIDRTGVVSGDALKVTGVEDVLLNQPLAVTSGNVVINAFAMAKSTIGLNAAIAATSGNVTLATRSTVAVKGAISTAGSVNVTTEQGIQVHANITGGSGGVSLSANQQATQTSGSFIGVDVSNATITTTNNGNIVLRGRGGARAYVQFGVRIWNGGVISNVGSGTVTVFGQGGSGTEAPISIAPLASGNVASSADETTVATPRTVADVSSSTILIGNPGTYMPEGSHGVWLAGVGTKVSSAHGAVSISGRAGFGTGAYHHGIYVTSGAVIESTGDADGAPIVLDGLGATGYYGTSGVSLVGSNTAVTSVTGPIRITGNGGSGSGYSRSGVSIHSGAVVASTGPISGATIAIVGFSGASSGVGFGFAMSGANTKVSSVSGAISIACRGGWDSGDADCDGVYLSGGATVESKGTVGGAPIAITGVAGLSAASNAGVTVLDARVVSAGAPIGIKGTGGVGATSWNHGVMLYGTTTVESTGEANAGAITIVGEGGGTGSGQGNTGVLMSVGQVRVKSLSGAIDVTGEAGSGDSYGLAVYGGEYGAANVSSHAGSIRFTSDSTDIGPAATLDAKTVVLRPRTPGARVDLGGGDAMAGLVPVLGLTNGELNRVFAETLIVGAPDAGEVSVTAPIVLSVPTDVVLRAGAGIAFNGGSVNTGGKSLFLAPGNSPAAVKGLTPGIDATASTVTLASALGITINGRTEDSEYSRLKVNGAVNLAGVDLVVSGSNTVPGEFVIVEGTSVTGTFYGLPNGSAVMLNGVPMVITYAADRVTLASPSNVTAGLVGRGLAVSGGATSDSVQILPGPAPRSFVVKGLGRTTVNGQPSVVVRNVTAGWRINLGEGNDALFVGGATSPVSVTGSVRIDVGMQGATSLVRLERLTVSGALTVRSAGRLSQVNMVRVDVGGQFSYVGSPVDDQVSIQGSRFRQHVSIAPDAGSNRLTITGTAFQRTVAINFALIGVTGIDAGLLSTPIGRAKGNTFSVRPQITGAATLLS